MDRGRSLSKGFEQKNLSERLLLFKTVAKEGMNQSPK